MTRNQNDTFRLNISVTGIPQPDVIWLKDSANFTSALTGATVSTSGLQITNAQSRTAGRYSVQATNCASSELQIYDIFIRCKSLQLHNNKHSNFYIKTYSFASSQDDKQHRQR